MTRVEFWAYLKKIRVSQEFNSFLQTEQIGVSLLYLWSVSYAQPPKYSDQLPLYVQLLSGGPRGFLVIFPLLNAEARVEFLTHEKEDMLAACSLEFGNPTYFNISKSNFGSFNLWKIEFDMKVTDNFTI